MANPVLNFTSKTNSVAFQIDNGEIDYIRPTDHIGMKALDSNRLILKGVVYKLTEFTFKINTVPFTGDAFGLADALDAVFKKAGGAASLTSTASKTDDTDAFASLSNGQSSDFEVSGVIARYSKNSAGTTFKNYNQYP